MKIKKINFLIAIVSIAISLIGFLIIYNDITAVPKYNKFFVHVPRSEINAI